MKYAAAAALLAFAGSTAAAGSITQTVDFTYDPFQDPDFGAFPVFELFDTMGGSRQLIGVTLQYDQTVSFDVSIESNGPSPIEEGNFFVDIFYLPLHQYGLAGDGGEGESSPPFQGVGGAGAFYSPGLGASDGFNGSGPDAANFSFDSGEFTSTFNYQAGRDQIFLDAFTGTGQLTTFISGFTELFGGFNEDPGFPEVDPNNPPEGPFLPFEDPYYGAFVTITNLTHSGTITATYTFIPAPGVGSLIAIAGLAGVRRRR